MATLLGTVVGIASGVYPARRASHLAAGHRVNDKGRWLNARVEYYSQKWTAVDGGGIFPGRSFAQAEYNAAAQVVIVNAKLAQTLFGDSDPLEKIIPVDGHPFQVI